LTLSKQSKAQQNMGAGYAFLPIKQVDLWPSDLESGVRVTCDVGCTSVPILVFLGLSLLDLGPMYATNRRQTDVRQKHRLMHPPIRGGA